MEVTTTDAYTIRLDVIANYKDRLVEQNRIPKDTPILIIIGRYDTSSLEAQVRGSRHAWSMRIVGIEAIIKLMEVNLSTSSDEVTEKIHTILRPLEYTRIDQIIDVVFTTVEDKDQQIEEEIAPPVIEEEYERRTQQRTPREIIDAKKSEVIGRLASRESAAIQKRRNSLYADPYDEVHAVIVVSKRYDDNGYWYAYHEEPQRKFLSQGKKGFLILAMTDKDFAFSIPFEILEKIWNDLHQTVLDSGRTYKHLLTYEVDGKFFLRIRNSGNNLELDSYKF